MTTTPYYRDDAVELHHGDCLDVLRTLPDASVDAVVTDPPYGLEFMGKGWDAPWQDSDVNADAGMSRTGYTDGGNRLDRPSFTGSTNPKCGTCKGTRRGRRDGTAVVPVCLCADGGRFPNVRAVEMRAFGDWCELWAAECLRVLKPGGHLLAFGGSRTWHRLAAAVEDAGFEIRDSIAWLYGSGFPKSLDVSKAIDRQRSEDRAPVDTVRSWLNSRRLDAGLSHDAINKHFGHASNGGGSSSSWMTNPTSKALPTWDQWLALKALLSLPDDMDAEVWRLNGRKGTPGDNFDAREVLSERLAEVKGGTWAEQVDSGRFRAGSKVIRETAPATDAARTWQGWGTALKPAFEPVVCARKPLTPVPYEGEANRLHHLLGGLLWLSLSPAKRAELDSTSSRPGPTGAWCASALAGAATATSPDASDVTDTFSSPALESTLWSIASSWSGISAALSDPTTTSTTSTASSTTTALRTLSSLLGPLTSQTTMPGCECLHDGLASGASSADRGSTVEWAKWLHTLSTSVPERAIDGIALVVESALARVAASLSGDLEAASSADPPATTGAGGSRSAFEPIVVGRKPLVGTVAANVLAHGTGALNVDGCRVGEESTARVQRGTTKAWAGGAFTGEVATGSLAGRWPTNVVLDESQAAELDRQTGVLTSGSRRPGTYAGLGYMGSESADFPGIEGDSGGASRFFPTFRYEAKAPTAERPRVTFQDGLDGLQNNGLTRDVAHPTVKPLDLMRWLVRLVTPPGGVVLEPFAGSGTTAEACVIEGFRCIAIEREADYLPLIVARLTKPIEMVLDFGEVS